MPLHPPTPVAVDRSCSWSVAVGRSCSWSVGRSCSWSVAVGQLVAVAVGQLQLVPVAVGPSCSGSIATAFEVLLQLQLQLILFGGVARN